MATTKTATYKIYNGTDWDTIYFKTSAGQVGETNGSLNFLRPNIHTVNGQSFWKDSKHQGITLYATDIKMSNATDASTISGAINDLHLSQDTISGQLDNMSQDYGNRIEALEGIVTGGTTGGGSLANTYETKTDAAAKLTNAKGYTDTQIASLSSDVDTRISGVISTIVDGAPPAYDTLKEIATWIQNDQTGAAAMSNTIANHTASISGLETNMADVIDSNPIVGLSVSGKTITYTLLSGGTGTITTQDTVPALNGAVSTIKDDNLTVNRALISNGSGKVAISSVTSTELGYLSGVTSAIQTQLNNKQAADANIRRIFEGSNTPTGMASGDIWISY